jgi:membrane associated rhomboid family serine protease
MNQFRMSGFQAIPPVIKNLLILNGLVFLAQVTFQNSPYINMSNLFALHDVRSEFFRPHQYVSHMFMHGDFWHLFFNMFILWMFGAVLENIWGSKRFLIFYVVCGLGAAFLHSGVLYYELSPAFQEFARLPEEQQEYFRYNPNVNINLATVGASGAIYGCLAAFAYLFPNSLLYIYFFFPIKAKYFVIFLAAMEFWLGISNNPGDNVAHWAHLGGAAVGFYLVWKWNRNRRRYY